MTKPRSIAGPAVTAGLALVLACAACSAPRPAVYPVRSGYEVRTPHNVVRDCGFSVPVSPGNSLWLFCDTDITTRQGQLVGLPILGTDTAAEAPYTRGHPPGDLTELPTPGDTSAPGDSAPRPFLPSPAGLTLPGSGLPCTAPDAYPARWITGAAAEPRSGHVLISYIDYCVSGADTFTPEAFGLVDYDPAGEVLGVPADVFRAGPDQPLQSQWLLGSPVFDGGWLYLFRSGIGTGVFLVRTPAVASGWQDGFTYQYWTGHGWSVNPAAGATLLDRHLDTPGPIGVSAGDYRADLAGFLIIEQTSLAGDFRVWQAPSPAGPWTYIRSGRVPCTKTAQQGAAALCRAIIGHPELSRKGELFVSFFDPGASHVKLASFGY